MRLGLLLAGTAVLGIGGIAFAASRRIPEPEIIEWEGAKYKVIYTKSGIKMVLIEGKNWHKNE